MSAFLTTELARQTADGGHNGITCVPLGWEGGHELWRW